jgi:hypothetical protein
MFSDRKIGGRKEHDYRNEERKERRMAGRAYG